MAAPEEEADMIDARQLRHTVTAIAGRASLMSAPHRRAGAAADAILATIVFTDIVDSTAHAAALGDERWTRVLAEHDAILRRELALAGGDEVKTTGDGFLVVFDSPGRAIRWAARVRDAVRPLGLELRSGIHTGECRRIHGDLAGIAVHLGARIVGLARPGEVLVSSTVKELVLGSALRFRDRGSHLLKGLEDPWRVYAFTEATQQPAGAANAQRCPLRRNHSDSTRHETTRVPTPSMRNTCSELM
jgi:class 3 adenylate cyclase